MLTLSNSTFLLFLIAFGLLVARLGKWSDLQRRIERAHKHYRGIR